MTRNAQRKNKKRRQKERHGKKEKKKHRCKRKKTNWGNCRNRKQLQIEIEQINFERSKILDEKKLLSAEKRELAEKETTHQADAQAMGKNRNELARSSAEQAIKKKRASIKNQKNGKKR